MAFGLKGGIGTASRKLANGSIVGALVQTNFGGFLSIAGAPVGVELGRPFEQQMNAPRGSVMIIIVTDAAVDSRNLKRLAARAMLGLGQQRPWRLRYCVLHLSLERRTRQ